MGDNVAKQFNWRHWKRGMFVAAVSGLILVMVNAGLMRKGDWVDALIFMASTIGTACLNFLQKHPVESIEDTVIMENPDK